MGIFVDLPSLFLSGIIRYIYYKPNKIYCRKRLEWSIINRDFIAFQTSINKIKVFVTKWDTEKKSKYYTVYRLNEEMRNSRTAFNTAYNLDISIGEKETIITEYLRDNSLSVCSSSNNSENGEGENSTNSSLEEMKVELQLNRSVNKELVRKLNLYKILLKIFIMKKINNKQVI